MMIRPIRGLFCLAILGFAAFLLGCGSSSCDQRLPAGVAGACPAGSSSSSGSGSGSGTPGTPANVGPFTIGGSVIGLTGTGLVIEDNGSDDLTISQNGAFTFKVAVPGGSNYKVIVKTQPTGQPLPCSVSNATGTANSNVTNVQVTCGNTFTVGGSVSGLQGTGMVLQDNGGDNLTLNGSSSSTGSMNFTFATPLGGGAAYNVTILTQPSNPGQTCSVSNGSGTANGNVTNVQVVCPQSGFTVGGSVVGLVDGAGDTVELMNNGGDNILVTGNNTNFTFPTLLSSGGAFDVNIFAEPTSQPQTCNLFGFEGVATTNFSGVLVDCQHNDWTWIDGPNTSGNYGTLTLPPAQPPAQDTNVPGGRQFAASWTDKFGQQWLFGGWGLDVTGASPPFLPGLLSDLWLWSPASQGWIPAALPITATTSGGIPANVASILPDQTPNNIGIVSGSGNYPGARWGSITWTDTSGNLFMFGGQGLSTTGYGLLNDLWEFTPGSYDVTTPPPPATPTQIGSYTETGTWTPVSNTATQDQPGTYPATAGTSGGGPGGRWGAAFATDPAGAFVWVFGGQGFDSAGHLGLLNDLWQYDIATQTWTWMGPTNSKVGQNNGAYGTQGIAAAGNSPGGRQAALLWVDHAGNVWLFGGLGLDSVGTRNPGALSGLANGSTNPDGALLNDLWKYNIGTGQWTWVSGGGSTGLADQTGVYGVQQTPAAANAPGSRWGAAGFVDTSNNLWVSTGWGYGSVLAQSTGYLNDVWEYQQSSAQWIWWKGSSDVNQSGSFTSTVPYGLPYVKNTPGGRFGAAYWKQDSFFYFWLFGGEGVDVSGSSNRLDDFLSYLPFP